MELDYEYLWQLQSPVHRDLAWLLGSPSLLEPTPETDVVSSSEYQAWFTSLQDWILEEDNLDFYLKDIVNTPRQYKLGLYAEDLFLYALNALPQYQLLIHDLQVFDEKRCIGAVDFIVRSTKTDEIEHWEMAIKYYLQVNEMADWNCFVGPSGSDSMARKRQKMLGRQLPLSTKVEAQQTFARHGIPVPTRRRIVSKGRFFQEWGRAFVPPKGTDPQQPTGTWIRAKDFVEQFIFSHKRWIIRRHPRWIAPFLTTDESVLLSTQDVLAAPFEKERFLMVSEMEACPQGWQEKHRWVVVVDDWKVMGDEKYCR